MIRRTTPQRVEQRVEARYPPPGDAADGFELEGQPVSLRDLSESGLQIGADLGADIGREVRVGFNGFPAIAGTVVWTDRGATGLRLPKGSLNCSKSTRFRPSRARPRAPGRWRVRRS
jgi:hypothetical protein